MTDAHLVWTKGGFARFLKVSDSALTLLSTVPSPPGSRIEGTFVDAPTLACRVKIHASRRQADGTFLLEGRPIDLTKEVRAHAALLLEAAEKPTATE